MRVGLATGISSEVLSEHARALSNRTLEPVVQYACVASESSFGVVRRHWIAGHAPSVELIGEDPECVGCTIAEDIIRSADDNQAAGIITIDVILPPGTDANHMAQRINDHEHLETSYYRVVLDPTTIDDDVRSDAEITTTNMITWEGDQRWVAHATIGLVSAADEVLLTEPTDGAPVALANHLNPGARVHTGVSALPPTNAVPARNATARIKTDASPPVTPPKSGGLESSSMETRRPFHPQRLLDAVTEVADHVVRVDGWLQLAGSGDTVFRLHVSAGLASLDPHNARPEQESTSYASRLNVTTNSHSSSDIHRSVVQILDHAILTPTEYRAGPTEWLTFNNPFRSPT